MIFVSIRGTDADCSTYKTCDDCHGDSHCAFWYCRDNQKGNSFAYKRHLKKIDFIIDWTGDMRCEKPGDSAPTDKCTDSHSKWSKLENNCMFS